MSSPAPGIEIRRAVADDATGIGSVHVESWQWAYRDQLPDRFLASLDRDRRIRWWRQALHGNPEMVTFVATEDDHMVGYCSVGASRTDGETGGELYSIYLLEHVAGRGIGRALLEAGLDALRAMGFEEAMLWVLGSNERTRRFYEASGWHDDGGRHTYTLRDGVRAAAMRYRIRLDAPAG